MLLNIPCLLMRGGTSKGPYFLAEDLPAEETLRDEVLLAVMGSPHVRQIDGIGGGDSLTSKAVIVYRSVRPAIDIEYLFAQVAVGMGAVDTAPNCGNMLAGIGPFAIERGLVVATDPTTTIRIYNRNTAKVIEAVVQTPGGEVAYDGDAKIDGVPGTGAPIVLNFLDAAGAKTGKLLPTGHPLDVIDGIEVTCVDLSSPLVFVTAAAMSKTGYETKHELDADRQFLDRLEVLRRKAALRMGLGDVSGKVLPKFALVASPTGSGNIASRYFVPWNCHSAYAVTGALCLGRRGEHSRHSRAPRRTCQRCQSRRGRDRASGGPPRNADVDARSGRGPTCPCSTARASCAPRGRCWPDTCTSPARCGISPSALPGPARAVHACFLVERGGSSVGGTRGPAAIGRWD
jgi:2-methylaconitate cis-trans-isomerase PrpF